ncbi:filamentous hemagglutinin N-terminal domain-containing protein [Helicobacter pullorum]|uniref:filamentous hemagglutinin N-terminal domain-containing protein n=1 Tax=Helicobacter pullorum TaxID=35818 RepID=UPI0008168F7B|nr:filamentous hemagglutinin N-terminal domain-containing protein [Helicobacter pullorum]OCR04272.1 hypothetical protein BA729_03715 [Helicobacter pullorum]OCR08227.1 hypothetical protein BA185_01315 [Helicobacter pullorum]
MGGGGNKPLTNSLNTKNSTPQKLTKNPKKIQESQKDSKTISKIGISIIASVLLSQNLVAANLPKNALPSGGKFVGGSSGSIKVNDKVMNITGNNTNHIIAWGGGFNIGKDAEVKFNTSHGRQASFLNLDYTNKASKILGKLNGNNHNIYLVNPSGVLIEQGASVNANRFAASTASLDKVLKDFTAKNTPDGSVASFSPVFDRGSLKGNVINMGTINAGNITLVGNEVRNLTSNGKKDVQGKYNNGSGANSLHIIGNKIFLDVEGVKNKKNIRLTGTNGIGQSNPQITVQMAMSTFETNGHKDWITKDYSIDGVQVGSGEPYVHRIITIGVEGGWNKFATAWNNNAGQTRSINEFKLIGNLNFSGVDFVSVGKPNNSGFNKIFNGNGYTMRNIKLDNNDASNNNGTIIAGVFNKVGGGTIKNLTIDRVTADITTDQAPTLHFGAFAGQINGGTIENVTLNNINIKGSIDYNRPNSWTNDNGYMGGFAGVINRGNISNVALNNIQQVFLYSNQTIGATLYVGGFAGRIANASNGSSTNINGVILNNIGKLRTDVRAGWGAKVNTLIGGFTAELGSGNSIRNAFLYYTANSLLMPALDSDGQLDGRDYVHTFYHEMNGGGSKLENIKIHYSNNHTDKTYDKVQVGSSRSDVRFGYTAKGMIDGIPGSYGHYYLRGEKTTNYYQGKVDFSGYTDRGGNFQNIVNGYNGVKVSGGNYSWVKQERISSQYPMKGDLNTSGDYTTLINTYLPQIIDDILEADYGVTIENENGSSTQKSLENIMAELDKILNVIKNKENERTADGKITNFLKQILVGNGKTDAELANQIESIKQSINFLRAFYDGYDNGSKQNAVTKTHAGLFANNTDYTNAKDKYNNTIKGGMTKLKTTINGKLTDIKTLEDTLKNLADALNKAQELNNQGKDLNTQVENIKNQVATLDGEIANLQKMISEMEQSGLIPPDKIAAVKAQLAAKKQQRSDLKTQVANIIADIEKLKDTDLANLMKEVDGYVATINGIREGFIKDLNINQAQDIDVMAGGAKGSFTYYGVETMAKNDIQDNINVPLPIDSIPLIPLEPSKPVDPTPDPNPDPNPNPDPDPITPPGGGDGGDGTDPDNPDNGGNNGGGDNGNNGGDSGDNGDNGDNNYEGDDTVNNNGGYDAMSRLAYLNHKREVLKLPAEEETSIEINEGREKGRLCIVSDNAKTNTPCMAITY